jgi:predicted small lipoprotein YifL
MKKVFSILAALLAIVMVMSCVSTGPTGNPNANAGTSAGGASSAPQERKVASSVPDFVKAAIKNAPEDALMGIGTAKAASLSLARTTATTRARAEISRQMNTMIQDMVRDYSAGSEVDPSAAISFQENITVALSKSTLTGSSIVDEDGDQNGYWVVVMLSKANTVAEISQAQAAAKLAVPALASFNAEDRMNDAFARAAGAEVGYSDR